MFDITKWSRWKINALWFFGVVVILAGWFMVNYYFPHPSPFPALFKST
jgi:hypothetical protein